MRRRKSTSWIRSKLEITWVNCSQVGKINTRSNESVLGQNFVLTGSREKNSLGAVQSLPAAFSTPAGTEKSDPPTGVGLALIAGILIACNLAARGQDTTVQEEPLPSSTDSTDYRVAEINAGPPPPSLPYAVDTYSSTGGAPGGENVPSGEPRRFHYTLRLTVRGGYDDNIFISNTNRVSDYYFAIEPAISIGFGDMEGRGKNYIRLDYMPSIILFVDHSNEDALGQLIHLEGRYQFSRLTLTLSQDVDLLDNANLNSFIDTTGQQANINVIARTRLNLFVTRLRANYELTRKLF